MRFHRITPFVLTAAVLIVFGAAGAASASTNRMPWSTVVGGLRDQPSLIGLSVDGSGFVAGTGAAGKYGHIHPGRLTWTTWNSSEGRAWGMDWIDNDNPCVACGWVTPYKASVHVWKPVGGVFSRMTISANHHTTTYRAVDEWDQAVQRRYWYWTKAPKHAQISSAITECGGYNMNSPHHMFWTFKHFFGFSLIWNLTTRNVKCSGARRFALAVMKRGPAYGHRAPVHHQGFSCKFRWFNGEDWDVRCTKASQVVRWQGGA